MMQAKAPRIGVTGPDEGGLIAWWFSRLALRRAGAEAVRITPARPIPAEKLDGLVIGGGADVTEPLLDGYVEAAPPRARRPRIVDFAMAPLVLSLRWVAGTRAHGADTARDALELSLLAEAERAGLPVLGICRGAQLMNLAAGGTLLRHVGSLYEERPDLYTVLPRREITLAEGSRLQAVMAAESVLVNSLHFHAVDTPGRDLRVVAREPSGVVQAIEHVTRPFWIGVQWHPEYLPLRDAQARIFTGLVSAARRTLSARETPVERRAS
jgi:putative glutamine amidotransferase